MNKIPPGIIVGFIVIVVSLAIFFGSQSGKNDALAHANDCAEKLPAFQASIIASHSSNSVPLFSYTSSGFLVAYSPKLNTCIGAYTDSSPDVLHGRSNDNENDYTIIDLLTNKVVASFSIDSELTKHPELDKTPFVDANIIAANAYALADYKAELSNLTDGKLP